MSEVGVSGSDRATIVPFIEDIFVRRGGERYLGEAVTLAEHMLQGATIAERNGGTRRDRHRRAAARHRPYRRPIRRLFDE